MKKILLLFLLLESFIPANAQDIEADIYEIKADGSAVFLTNNAIRARYSESLGQEKLLTPAK